MSAKTGIEWTGRTWNPTTGCDKVSAGCKHCYAETLAHRLQRQRNPRYRNGFKLTLHRDKATEPLGWPKPEWVFVNSMSDLLHKGVPTEFLARVFRTMRDANWHRFQVLTKRPQRWAEVTKWATPWPRNVVPGTSIEDRNALVRLDHLARAGDSQTVRMLSIEPLLESLGKYTDLARWFRDAGIGWVITGGEAGYKARPAELDWFREVRDACRLAGIPYFHKQHGGKGVTKTAKRGEGLAILDGRLHHEMPDVWHEPGPPNRETLLLDGLAPVP